MRAKLRKNSITLTDDSGKSSDTWGKISDHHLYKDWLKVCKHFKSRGFLFKTQKYHEDNNWGKPYNKVGFKSNGVCVLLELGGKWITIEVDNISNLWDSENNFWEGYDDRSVKLNYLDSKRIELEISKFLKPYPEKEIVKEFKGAEFIINNKKESWHSHHKEKLDELGLEGVKFQMSDYDLKSYNSKDKNKKQIECGEEKYFYNGKSLQKGLVYHNINNMWWILCGGEVRNKASFELFDYAGQPKRKPLTEEQKINRLEQELRKLER